MWLALLVVAAFGGCLMALLSLAFWRFPTLWAADRRLRAYALGVSGIAAGYLLWLAVVGLGLELRLEWWQAAAGFLGIVGAEGTGVAAVHRWQQWGAAAAKAAVRRDLEDLR